jgi:hypothetical protein
MSLASNYDRHASPRRRAGIFSILVLVLTTVHHAYGALVYHTPWRLHVAVFALPIALAIYFGLRAGAKADDAGKGRALGNWVGVLILSVPVGAIGLFEGAYNHLFKNILYFGWGMHAMREFFPVPMYEMPNDRIFEATGIAQFPLALVAAYWTIVMLVRLRNPRQGEQAAIAASGAPTTSEAR